MKSVVQTDDMAVVSPPKFRLIVSDTPPGLNEGYGRVLQNIVELDDEDRERAVAIPR